MKLILSVALFAVTLSASANFKSWYQSQQERSKELLLENISRDDTLPGFVVAAASKVSPPYYYHWVRDAALVMAAIDKYLPDGVEKEKLFSDYIKLVDFHQQQPTITGLGEPKFNPDGTGYEGPWGRPQNDGPALRAITLSKYALKLIAQGKKDFVAKYLYKAQLPANTVIKRDLEYVSHNWQRPDFDLWEEVMGTHFYTKMAQRAALFLGAEVAKQFGDQSAANWYIENAWKIDNRLNDFYSKQKGHILSTLDRVGGLDYKYSNLDASVILAVNHSSIEGLSFSKTDKRVENTYKTLVSTFSNLYAINSDKSLGTAIGRYPEDRYYGTNPWFLLTNAMAEYHLSRGEKDQAKLYVMRVRKHMSVDGRMDEQYSSGNGFMLGAKDLTWSYASFLTIGNF